MGGVVSLDRFECGSCTLPQRECESDVRDVTLFPKFREAHELPVEVHELQLPVEVRETVRVIMTERPDIQDAVRVMMNEGVPLSLRPDVQCAIAQVMMNEGVPLRPDIQESMGTLPFEMHPFMNPIVNDECVKTKRNKRRRRQRKPRDVPVHIDPHTDPRNEAIFKDNESREQFLEFMTNLRKVTPDPVVFNRIYELTLKQHEDAIDPFTVVN